MQNSAGVMSKYKMQEKVIQKPKKCAKVRQNGHMELIVACMPRNRIEFLIDKFLSGHRICRNNVYAHLAGVRKKSGNEKEKRE